MAGKSKISFVGSGNVAFQLARAFDLAGYRIHQVVSRNRNTGKELASKFAAFFHEDLQQLMPDADFVFLCLPDKEIEPAAKSNLIKGPVVVHCAGSCSLRAISDHITPAAVFYPLQTFTRNRNLDFFKVPVLIEASDAKTLAKIKGIAMDVSNTVLELGSENRAYLHLAAVMANNFTNHLLAESENLMKQHSLPFGLLKPLVEETVKKAFDASPAENQTGPAIRNDRTTIQRHLEMLKGDPSLSELYRMISEHIQPGSTLDPGALPPENNQTS